MSDEVVIAAFRNESEARRAEEALGADGIAARTARRSEEWERLCEDIFANGWDVIVGRGDAQRGIALLQKLWPDPARAEAAKRCPRCGSADLTRLPRLRIFLMTAAALLLANLLIGQRELILLLIAIVAGMLLILPAQRCRAC